LEKKPLVAYQRPAQSHHQLICLCAVAVALSKSRLEKPIHECPDPFMNGKSYSEWNRPMHECSIYSNDTLPCSEWKKKPIPNAKTYSE
jgi:hypothetical protein